MRYVACAFALLASLLLQAGDAAKVGKSGPQVNGSVGAFEVHDVTGANKGKTLCYVCQSGPKPVAIIFAREVSKGLASLVKEVDGVQKANKNSVAFLVLLDKDKEGAKEKCKKLAAETGASIPLTVNDSGEKSPEGYDLNSEVKYTILVYKNKKVVNNFALNEITDQDVKAIAEATKKNAG